MAERSLAELRRDYSLKELSRLTVDRDPFVQFSYWMDAAIESGISDPNAMTLATVDPKGRPSARVVLLKGYGPDGMVFFTNYESKKGNDLAGNPNAALHFFWRELERQVAITGRVQKTSAEESESYFQSRPEASRLGAWASKQSQVIRSRRFLEDEMESLRTQFEGREIPCPPYWGGYRLVPACFEFWQGRQSRLHDRIVYEHNGESWEIFRLSP